MAARMGMMGIQIQCEIPVRQLDRIGRYLTEMHYTYHIYAGHDKGMLHLSILVPFDADFQTLMTVIRRET